MTFDGIGTFYTGNQTLIAGLGALAGVAVLLLAAHRLRKMKEHRATLLVANILTIIAAAAATMVSASGMWKFFTDILGQTPLRIVFFAFIEIALFACALLARSRLLRDPQQGSTGVDGVAVWVLAGLTATLSALDSDSFREVCLRLVAPLVAAWMWERALAAERHVRLGGTARRINWTLTPERILVWLRLAEAHGREVSEVDRARRRAKLGRARLHLHLLQSRKSLAWRVRRAHHRVIRQAMHAAEHIGLAEFPEATNERQAIQMYMATLYGFVEATSPQAVAHLNAWQQHTDSTEHTTELVDPCTALHLKSAQNDAATGTTNAANAATVLTSTTTGQTAQQDTDHTTAHPRRTQQTNRRHGCTTVVSQFTAPQTGNNPEATGRRSPDPAASAQRLDLDSLTSQAGESSANQRERTGDPDNELNRDNQPDDQVDLTAVAAMRRFWDREVSNGRAPTGAELSRAAGVPPITGLGRRKRREWEADLPQHLKSATGAYR